MPRVAMRAAAIQINPLRHKARRIETAFSGKAGKPSIVGANQGRDHPGQSQKLAPRRFAARLSCAVKRVPECSWPVDHWPSCGNLTRVVFRDSRITDELMRRSRKKSTAGD